MLKYNSGQLRVIFLAALISLVPSARAKDCYFPDGSLASKYQPCDDAADDSPCCAESDNVACLSSGLCYGQYGYVYRGGCTDKTWSSSACPKDHCLKYDYGGMNILACNDATGYWCCAEGLNTPCCQDSSKEQFYLNPGTITYVATGLSTVATNTETVTETDTITSTEAAPDADTVTVTTTATAAADTITTTITTTATLAADTITTIITRISTAVPVPAGTATIIVATGAGVTSAIASCATAAGAAATVVPENNRISTGAAVGIGIGVALPTILAIAFAALWLLERYKRKHLESAAAAASTVMPTPIFLTPPAPPAPPVAPMPRAYSGHYGAANGMGGDGSYGGGGLPPPPMAPPMTSQPSSPRAGDNYQNTVRPGAMELHAQSAKPPDYAGLP